MKTRYGLRGKRVYYFAHKNGVLERRRLRGLFAFAGVFTTFSILGGGLVGINYLIDQNREKAVYQQRVVQSSSEKKQTEPNQLKNSPTKAQEDEQLAKLISAKVKTMPKGQKWSVHVRDLKSNKMANVNSDDMMEASSLSQLFLLAPLEKKTYSDYWRNWVGGKPIATCVEEMVKNSDGNCASAIGNYANWKTIDETNKSFGFSKTKISKEKAETNAREVGELVYRLQNSQILSDKARRIVFDGFYGQKHRLGIPIGCGSECLVGNKSGESGSVKHDAAVVSHKGAKYIIVIMSEGGNWQQIGDIAKLVDGEMDP